MTKVPTVGQLMENPEKGGYPVTVQAIAASWCIADIAVVLAYSDITGYVVADYDMSGRFEMPVQNGQFWATEEEAGQDWLSRAMNVTL